MTPPRSLWLDASIGGDDCGYRESSSDEAREERRARRETLAAVDRFDDWQRTAPSLRHVHTVATHSALASKRIEAVAYVIGESGMPHGEVTGYGRTTLDAIEDLARRGALRGVW